METQYILVIIFGILTLLILASFIFINGLFARKEKIDLLFENVMKYIDERILLIERMSNFVEENIEEEINYVNQLNNYNDSLNDMFNTKKYDLKELKKSEKLLKKFAELIETHSFLSKNQIYKILADETTINIERIDYATESYNEKAKEYNEFKETKINKFIAKIFRLKDYEIYNK